MWIHEVCRTVLDRFSDASTKNNIFKKVKTIASGTFKVREKNFNLKPDDVFYTYGSIGKKAQYRQIPEQEAVL